MKLMLHQPSLLDEDCLVATAVKQLADAKNVKERGAVFTRPEVVDFMLDLAGYVSDRPLHDMRLLEPSFGEGSFLLPVIGRLLAAWQASDDGRPAPEALSGSIRAVELHADTYRQTRAKVLALLDSAGLGEHAVHLADRWLVHGDFLLSQMDAFDVVVGNPPYVRQEIIPAALLAEYRRQFATIYDRADLYIPFIERSLSLLKPHGTLAFICADRWMKNRYGGPLRAMIAGEYRLKIHVDMTDTPAFQSDVIAYPAIIVITREPSGVTRVASNPLIEPGALTALSMRLLADESPERNSSVRELAGVAMGNQPWLLETSHRIAVVRRLEVTFPTLEEAGCKVGIGVATGADKAFIGLSGELDVEEDRKEPLVMTGDIVNGAIEWRGFSVVNPFADDGSLVDLGRYPRLKKYLEARRGEIANRHCARKIPANWYRTIDRITPALTRTPKLLVPDIKGEAHVVYDEGRLYPHHNLYFITAQEWNLHALQAVLLSEVARLFVATYSTRMRGGFLRFQAQYLRRIRLPYWNEVPDELRQCLTAAGLTRNLTACNLAACTLYGLSARDRVLLKVDPTGHD